VIKPTKIVPIKMADIDRVSDIGVEAKDNPIVMIYANHRGRKAIDALWSGMHWTTDDIFRTMHDDNWLFAHVMVTGIPERFSKGKPVSDAQPDALSFLVALALSARSRKLRVFHYTGEFGEQPKISVYRGAAGALAQGTPDRSRSPGCSGSNERSAPGAVQ
jgi:hypothetical protein